ncbi:MAG: V-type ATP synthase subunit I [Spirochaetota bacterium]
MIFTSEMVHLTAVVLRGRSEAVSRALLDVGAVQFNRLSEIRPDLGARLHAASVHDRRQAVEETRRRIEQLLQTGGFGTPAAAEIADARGDVDVSEINGRIDRLARDVERYRTRQGEIQRRINRVADVRRQIAAAGQAGSVALLGSGVRDGTDERRRFLDVRHGTVSESRLGALDREIGRLSGLVIEAEAEGKERHVVVIAMKRNASDTDRVLAESGFRPEELPRVADGRGIDALEQADERLALLRAEQEEQADRIRALVADRKPQLETEWRKLRVVELLLTIRSESSESEYAVVFSGWVPRRKRERVDEAVRAAAGDDCHLEWHAVADMETGSQPSAQSRPQKVPVELRNPAFLRPFQMLVRNFGIPEYGTIDPTPLVALAYLLMFGLMFGDAGHGLVLVVLGLVGRRVLRSPGYREISRLLVWCGGASIVMGVIFGAYFGLELFPPLWFDYHGVVVGRAEAGPVRNLMEILTITIYFGIAVIGAGLIINWINRIRRHEWLELFFHKEGILGGVIYATGVWVAAVFARSGFRVLPDLTVAGLLIVIPAVALFAKFPIHAARARRDGRSASSPAMWVMDWAIELLEIFSGYLANTLSFMRVAGLGIAHVMLMVAFFQIEAMIAPEGVSVVSLIVLVAGNALVIALEGLSAGIQSLRLNYYEFFSKYFVPTGVEFRPVSLHTTAQGG